MGADDLFGTEQHVPWFELLGLSRAPGAAQDPDGGEIYPRYFFSVVRHRKSRDRGLRVKRLKLFPAVGGKNLYIHFLLSMSFSTISPNLE